MGLKEILEGIDQKVREEVENIKKEAESEKEKILKEAEIEAEKKKNRMIEEAKREIDEEMRRELVRVRREEKRKTLTLKSDLMRETFEEARNKFLNLDKNEYLSLMMDALVANLNRGDEEILFSPAERQLINRDFVKRVEEALLAKGKKPQLKFSYNLDKFERGFIVQAKDIRINCTISSLFSTIKDREEVEVAKILFG
ncbi:hypothetical protein H5U35_05565 [Candidatus Aerophobetes bacterium]|nr:hypothetical protein [Candidatus Aerophobetes bacterium]